MANRGWVLAYQPQPHVLRPAVVFQRLVGCRSGVGAVASNSERMVFAPPRPVIPATRHLRRFGNTGTSSSEMSEMSGRFGWSYTAHTRHPTSPGKASPGKARPRCQLSA